MATWNLMTDGKLALGILLATTISSRAVELGSSRPWRYADHVGPSIAIPSASASPLRAHGACLTAPEVACPAPATGCCVAPYSPGNRTGCLVPTKVNSTGGCAPPCHNPPACCTPGAPLPLSTALKNVLIFGDSVSIDYTTDVKGNLSGLALVQHAPWDTSDGGAGSTSFMVNCLDVFMRGADGSEVKWDLIFFNSGLHNLNNSTKGLAAYKDQLGMIVAGMQKLQPQAKLVWATTTPFMPDKNTGNFAVEQQNAIAAVIMTANAIPSVDLYARVTAKCGELYVKCDICDDESRFHPGFYCGYHYTAAGFAYISQSVIETIRNHLPK